MPPKRTSKSKFNYKDLVLAKMAGFPAWPSFIMPPDLIPSSIMKVKKKSTEFCVIFIPDGDYNWMNEKNLEALTIEKLDKKLEKVPDMKKSKQKSKNGRTNHVTDALLATKGLEFDDFMDQLDKRNNGDEIVKDEDDEDEEDDEEVKNEDGDEEDEEDEAEEVKEETDVNKIRPKRKNIKREEKVSEADDEDESNQKITSRPSNGNSNGKRIKSEHEEEPPTKRTNGHRRSVSTPSTSSSSSSSNKSKTITGSSAKLLTEEEKQHQLWLCRIKLQRSLIQRNQPVTPTNLKQFPPPSIDELSVARLILHRLVEFPVNIELLKQTKIHKVLKCILKDEELEYPDSFKLHEKCEELLNKWNSLIDALKLEKMVKSNNSSLDTKNDIDLQKNNNSRLSSQPPDELEISAVETNGTPKKRIDNGNLIEQSPILNTNDVPVAASVEG